MICHEGKYFEANSYFCDATWLELDNVIRLDGECRGETPIRWYLKQCLNIFIFTIKLCSKLIVKHFDIFMALLQRTLSSGGDRRGRIRSTTMYVGLINICHGNLNTRLVRIWNSQNDEWSEFWTASGPICRDFSMILKINLAVSFPSKN